MKLPSLEEEAFLGLMIELGVLGVPPPTPTIDIFLLRKTLPEFLVSGV